MTATDEITDTEEPRVAEFPLPVVRTTAATAEIRAVEDDRADPDSLGLLEVRFSTFNEWYRVASLWEGEFLERVAPGAFKQTIDEDREGMRVLFDHGFNQQVGSKVLGPIEDLREDGRKGPVAEVPLFDTTYNRDLLPGLQAGVYGSSFRMQVREEKWRDEPDPSDYNPKGLPERTITNARVFKFGPVTFPANPGATASMRSATDQYMERLARQDATAYEVALRSVQHVRPDFTGVPTTRSGGTGAHDPALEAGSVTSTASTTEQTPPAPGNGNAVALRDLSLRQRDLLLRAQGVITHDHD